MYYGLRQLDPAKLKSDKTAYISKETENCRSYIRSKFIYE
jgi:hypothetical protein